ncbi:MAG: HEAT repeat domain-containing protein [Spirosomataceae bacterium]
MNPDQRQSLLADYVSGQLSEPRLQEVERLLASDPQLRHEANEMQAMWRLLEKPTEQEPPAEMDHRFYAFLEQEHEANEQLAKVISLTKGRNLWLDTFKYAAGLALLIGAFMIGRSTAPIREVLVPQVVYKTLEKPAPSASPSVPTTSSSEPQAMMTALVTLKKEMQATKELVMLSMLKQESASERIKAVNYSYEMKEPDKKVLDALIQTLNQDTNTNVRMAAAEALSHFGDDRRVRDALIQALRKQQEPMLQVAVIEILVNLREKRAIPDLMALSDSEQLPSFVRDKAEEGVSMLSL